MVGRSTHADLLSGLNALSHVGVAGNLSDAQLLDRFLARGGEAAEAAFRALAARHGPMVLDVCSHVLRDPHDAQDAFQATFLVLAARAGAIRRRDAVAGWLLGVARRVALRSRTDRARRRACERRAAEMKADLRRDRTDAWPELHEEIGRLPERYREPVVLCYLEGLSTEAAALRLGSPRGTVLSRLSRARARLQGGLTRRGLAPPGLLAAGIGRQAIAPGLLHATVRASLGLAGREATAAVLSSAAATVLARRVIHAVTISKLTVLGAAALACVLTLGGIRSFARRFDGIGVRTGAERKHDQPQITLTQAVDKLESDLDESARRITEARKAPQDIRADLKAGRANSRASVGTKTANRLADAIQADRSGAVSRLADALKRHLVPFSGYSPYRSQIYMLDLVEGGTTLIAGEPAAGLDCCGMPTWSHDGSRILFEAAEGQRWPLARLFAIEARHGRATFTDLGLGNHPTLSPNDRWVAFLLHPSAELRADTGLWLMNADGSQRRRVGEFGAPFWSPDGREFMVNSYSLPTESTIINLETKEGSVIEVPGRPIFSWPSWVGPGTVVSTLAPTAKYDGDSIALLDVRRPAEAKIIEILWRRSDDLDVTPRWPVYRPETGQCFFTGDVPNKRALYSVRRGESLRARPMGVVVETVPNTWIGGLSFSPDGRYLLFHANGPVLN
jgi:RNA polymerase sigma factor (sigma-70 family)